jgi:hypothetical protein
MPYAHSTLSQIAAMLGDPQLVRFNEAELIAYIQEALSTLHCAALTARQLHPYFRRSFLFATDFSPDAIRLHVYRPHTRQPTQLLAARTPDLSLGRDVAGLGAVHARATYFFAPAAPRRISQHFSD